MGESENPSAPAISAAGEQLDGELAELLEVERFEPSPKFRAQALLNDPAIYEQAAGDPLGWWAEQAEQLHWFSRWERAGRLQSALLQMVCGRHDQCLLQLPGPPRAGGAR